MPLLPPALAAYMAATAALTMPPLLWIGLGSRFAAAALLVMTAVIQTFVYPDAYITHGLGTRAPPHNEVRRPGAVRRLPVAPASRAIER